MKLLYVMDPMCAWCYGFQAELEQLLSEYPFLSIEWVMGGLAPDTTQPMSSVLQEQIAQYWIEIERLTQVRFNHKYWQLNTPYRSTYPACRAVIAAENLVEQGAHRMVVAIQRAYYQRAKNPSLIETLSSCASEVGIDHQAFLAEIHGKHTESVFQEHLGFTRRLRVTGFPALFYIQDSNQVVPLTLGYSAASELKARLLPWLE